MPEFTVATASDSEIDAIVDLWTRCGLTRPWNDPHADIALARSRANATVLVGRADENIVAALMVGHDGHRGWFYYLAVDPAMRGHGYGRRITAAAESWLAARNIAKVMLMVRPDNGAVAAFYKALG
jgi:ribosomal protein S18 acetylase RimI-like enzyme